MKRKLAWALYYIGLAGAGFVAGQLSQLFVALTIGYSVTSGLVSLIITIPVCIYVGWNWSEWLGDYEEAEG